jgi:hypothetical protein
MKFRIQNSKFKIALFGATILICVFSLNSFSKFEQVKIPHYKTLNDSVFEEGDVISLNVSYKLSKCELENDSVCHSTDSLARVAEFLTKYPRLIISIDNHSDIHYTNSGTKMTQCRALLCVDALINFGIDRSRLVARGFEDNVEPFILYKDVILPSGKVVSRGIILTDKFLVTFKSNKADYEFLAAMNRRTEITILSKDFKK